LKIDSSAWQLTVEIMMVNLEILTRMTCAIFTSLLFTVCEEIPWRTYIYTDKHTDTALYYKMYIQNDAHCIISSSCIFDTLLQKLKMDRTERCTLVNSNNYPGIHACFIVALLDQQMRKFQLNPNRKGGDKAKSSQCNRNVMTSLFECLQCNQTATT
jgi:hypothetical protein